MHKCVHAWLAYALESDQYPSFANAALDTVSIYAINVLCEYTYSNRVRRLLPHANRCLDLVLQGTAAQDKFNFLYIYRFCWLGLLFLDSSYCSSKAYTVYLDTLGLPYPVKSNLRRAEESLNLALQRAEATDTVQYPSESYANHAKGCALRMKSNILSLLYIVFTRTGNIEKALEVTHLKLQVYRNKRDTWQWYKTVPDILFCYCYSNIFMWGLGIALHCMSASILYRSLKEASFLDILALSCGMGTSLSWLGILRHWTKRRKMLLLWMMSTVTTEAVGWGLCGRQPNSYTVSVLIVMLLTIAPVIVNDGVG